jgi:hypothetical protein
MAALLLCAASAGAAVRFAAPTGAGPNPCNPTACSLKVAIDGAQDGDEVVVGPGFYAQATTISVAKAINVGGSIETTQPTVGLKGVQFEVRNPGAVVHDLRFTLTESAMARPFVMFAGTAERIVADPGGRGADACLVGDGVLRDSLCVEGLSVGGETAGAHEVTLAGVTADPVLLSASSGEQLAASIVDTIAYPAPRPFTSKAGIQIDASTGGSVTAVIRNSNFNEVETSLSTGTAFTYTAAGTNGNQIAPPQLVDPVHGDFRPLSTSPTIDAGVTDPSIGSFDVFGLPRVQPRCIGGTPIPDIGAYEFQPTEACPGRQGPASGPAPVSPVPKKQLRIGKPRLKLDKSKGTGLLTFRVPAAGKVSVSGKGVAAAALVAKKAGKVSLPVRAKGRQKGRLESTGKVKLKVLIKERLDDGTRLARKVPVTLKLRPAP